MTTCPCSHGWPAASEPAHSTRPEKQERRRERPDHGASSKRMLHGHRCQMLAVGAAKRSESLPRWQ